MRECVDESGAYVRFEKEEIEKILEHLHNAQYPRVRFVNNMEMMQSEAISEMKMSIFCAEHMLEGKDFEKEMEKEKEETR